MDLFVVLINRFNGWMIGWMDGSIRISLDRITELDLIRLKWIELFWYTHFNNVISFTAMVHQDRYLRWALRENWRLHFVRQDWRVAAWIRLVLSDLLTTTKYVPPGSIELLQTKHYFWTTIRSDNGRRPTFNASAVQLLVTSFELTTLRATNDRPTSATKFQPTRRGQPQLRPPAPWHRMKPLSWQSTAIKVSGSCCLFINITSEPGS